MGRKKPKGDTERILFTFTEAQEFLGVSHQTIYKFMGKHQGWHLSSEGQ